MWRIWLFLLVLLIAPAASRAEDSPEWTLCTTRPTIETSNDAVIAACITVLDAAKEPPDRLAIAVFSRGLAFNRAGQHDKAYADFTASLRFNPKFARVFVARGYDLVADGKYDAAIREFNQAIGFDPKLVEAYYGRGLAYGASEQVDRSIKDHQKAIELNPKYAPAYFGLGLEYRAKKQLDRAIGAFNKAIELDPQYAQALYNRGNTYAQQNKIDRAIGDYSAAIQIEPDYANAHYMRGLAYRDTGKTEQALADLDAAVRINPKFEKAIEARDALRSSVLANASAPPNGQEEETVFALYMARAGNQACDFGVDDEEKAALEHEADARLTKASISSARASELDARATFIVAKQKNTDPKFCAPNGDFAGKAREMFDAVADRPKRQQ